MELPSISNEEEDNIAENVLGEFLEDLLKSYEKEFVGAEEHQTLPLVRVKVEYSGFDILRFHRIESRFKDKIANEG